jgi:hypothetical protein
LVAATNSVLKIPLFQSGRLISLFFSLISGGIIGLMSFNITGNRLLGGFAAILFWGHPYVMIWSSLARVDLMALAFSLIGLWILYRHWESPAWLSLACICLLASVFTRQTYLLAAPLAGFIWLWYHNPRRALAFVLFYAGIGLLIFWLINSITHGGFYDNIVVSNINQYEISRTLNKGGQLMIIWPVILIISVLCVIYTVWSKFKKQGTNPFGSQQQPFILYGLVFYTLGAFLSALTVGKVGSDVNYFLELIAASAIWCAIAMKFIANQKEAIKRIFFGFLFIQLIWVLAGGYMFNRITIGELWHRLDFYNSTFLQVQSATKNGVVLSDDYMDMVVLSGQSIYYQPFEYGQLYEAGLWDAIGLANEVNNQKFPLILIGGETLYKGCCWPSPITNAIESNYRIETTLNVLIITPMK